MTERNDDGVRKLHIPEQATPGDKLVVPTNASYLKWVRVTANDKQLLRMRDDQREQIKALKLARDAQVTLQEDMQTLLRIVAYVLDEYVREPERDELDNAIVGVDGEVEYAEQKYPLHVDIQRLDLARMGGKHFTVDNVEGGWRLTLTETDA